MEMPMTVDRTQSTPRLITDRPQYWNSYRGLVVGNYPSAIVPSAGSCYARFENPKKYLVISSPG